MTYIKKNLMYLIILIFSLAGLAASMILSIEKVEILKDPSVHLACNINSVFNCASVMNSKAAEVLGFPNSFFGIIYYTGLFVIALLALTGSQINRYLKRLILLTVFLGAAFSYWLLSYSVFSIRVLCIYCLISCFSATNIFFAYFAETTSKRFGKNITKWYFPAVTLWYLLIIGVIIFQLNIFQK